MDYGIILADGPVLATISVLTHSHLPVSLTPDLFRYIRKRNNLKIRLVWEPPTMNFRAPQFRTNLFLVIYRDTDVHLWYHIIYFNSLKAEKCVDIALPLSEKKKDNRIRLGGVKNLRRSVRFTYICAETTTLCPRILIHLI